MPVNGRVWVFMPTQVCESLGLSLMHACSTFKSNRVAANGNNNVPAFYAYRSTCHFLGTTTFTHNEGGGLGLSQSIAFASGRLQFEHNVAVYGGGLRLLNSAVVRGGRAGCSVVSSSVRAQCMLL